MLTENMQDYLDQIGSIPKLWDELQVTDEYKATFVNITLDLDYSIKKEFFNFELNNLTKFSELLTVKLFT